MKHTYKDKSVRTPKQSGLLLKIGNLAKSLKVLNRYMGNCDLRNN
jgi:hypothetical protein